MHISTLCTASWTIKDKLELIEACIFYHMVYQCWYAFYNILTQITIDQITNQRVPSLHCSHSTFPIWMAQFKCWQWFDLVVIMSGFPLLFPIISESGQLNRHKTIQPSGIKAFPYWKQVLAVCLIHVSSNLEFFMVHKSKWNKLFIVVNITVRSFFKIFPQ